MTHPVEADAVDHAREHVAEHGGKGRIGGKEGEKVGMLPVSHAGHDLFLDVLHDVLIGIGLHRWLGRKQLGKVARLDLRQH